MPPELREAANVGDWLQSEIHSEFAEEIDRMLKCGAVTHEEWTALQTAMSAAIEAFRSAVQQSAAQLYQRAPWVPCEGEGDGGMAMMESSVVPLVEKAVRRDGTIPLKLIKPGWGTTGYYPANVLESDGPKVFKAGTKMFWNHPTLDEEMERPEGDLNSLAAELVSDARYDSNGVDGPGLYADAKVFEAYQSPVNDLAPHIGVSIRAIGPATSGSAEGRQGLIIQGIKAARSVDFVTQPGAGGKILDLFEAARPRSVKSPVVSKGVDMELEKQLKEANDRLATLEQENARLREGLLLREGAEFVAAQLASSTLPQVTRERLASQLIVNLPLNGGVLDKAVFTQRIAEAVKAETDYLAQVAGYGAGKIAGMGSPVTAQKDDDSAKRLQESLQALGLSEKSAAGVAVSRVW